MPTTYYAMSLMTASESWRAIRTIRAEPTGTLDQILQNDRARRREFHMALEQAQQQFSAAERIGYESRPLNLFYGLSQAGRALAAGSERLGRGTNHQWQASGHGLKYDVGVPTGVLRTDIQQEGGTRDLFSRVSIAINSPLDFEAVEFGAAMNQLLDYTMVFREKETHLRPITDVHVYNAQPQSFPLEVEIPVPGLIPGERPSVARVKELLRAYPALDDLELALNDVGGVRWSHNEGRCLVILNSADRLQSREGHGTFELAGAQYYRGTGVLLPRSGKSLGALSPLMSWWTVLYALSMLARYAPGNWTETLSIAESPIASKIEFLLDAALDAVPELLWRELQELADGKDVEDVTS